MTIQQMLPIFKNGINLINSTVGYEKRDGNVYYYVGQAIIGMHKETNIEMFRWMTSMLTEMGNAKQSEIVRAFEISNISVKRYAKKYRECNGDGEKFFSPRNVRGAAVVTPEKIIEIEKYFEGGDTLSEISLKTGIKADTIKKAVKAGRVKKKLPK